MNALIKHTGTIITKGGTGLPANLPQRSHGEEIEAVAVRLNEAGRALVQTDYGHAVDRALAEVDELFAGYGIERLRDLVAERRRPATKVEIAKLVTLLVASKANTARVDGELYIRMLIEDIGAQAPSVGALDDACRHLRRTLKWLPECSEVLDALRAAESRLRSATWLLDRLPDLIAKASAAKVREAEIAVELRRRQKAEIRDRLIAGKHPATADLDLVEEVRAELAAADTNADDDEVPF